jgi:hypothetical protein
MTGKQGAADTTIFLHRRIEIKQGFNLNQSGFVQGPPPLSSTNVCERVAVR